MPGLQQPHLALSAAWPPFASGVKVPIVIELGELIEQGSRGPSNPAGRESPLDGTNIRSPVTVCVPKLAGNPGELHSSCSLVESVQYRPPCRTAPAGIAGHLSLQSESCLHLGARLRFPFGLPRLGLVTG